MYCNFITKEEAIAGWTLFLLLLLTMRSSSYVEIVIALDVTCSLVIDEPVSEGKRESHLHVKGVQYQTLID